jgi:6-phosphogluconolactonase
LPAHAPFDRLTLTLPALLDTDAVLLVIRGAEKLALFEQAVAGAVDLPITRLLDGARWRGVPVTCLA